MSWVPFITPFHALQPYWFWLLVPLSFGVSMIYRGLRMETFERYWWQVLALTTFIVLSVIGLAIALAVLVEWVIPAIPLSPSS